MKVFVKPMRLSPSHSHTCPGRGKGPLGLTVGGFGGFHRLSSRRCLPDLCIRSILCISYFPSPQRSLNQNFPSRCTVRLPKMSQELDGRLCETKEGEASSSFCCLLYPFCQGGEGPDHNNNNNSDNSCCCCLSARSWTHTNSTSASSLLSPQRGRMCEYMLLKWYCDECGAWYTSDEVRVGDCGDFEAAGACERRDLVREEESDAAGLCDDCTGAQE
ncbi:hypothetical protein F4780DRAFT_750725 [Xylariomycetidae sp. FL0641]|nr:hypothetical protein F4780DRAFT_750725 [Xylariomycetidae sp. FL0641]